MASSKQRPLRIAIVTENFMPKVDGVTRTLARLLAHLRAQGHTCVVLGPESGMSSYETHALVGTAGIPLVLYPGLKLNFLRPKFLRTIVDFVRRGHIALLGTRVAAEIMWRVLGNLHARCQLTACPSNSTAHSLETNYSFSNLRLWPRGVDTKVYHPSRRSSTLRDAFFTCTGTIKFQDVLQRDSAQVQASKRQSDLASKPWPLTPPPSPALRPVPDAQAESRAAVLYVGRLSYEKNLVFLLHAFAMLAMARNPDQLKLVLVGDGPARGSLEREVEKLALSKHVLFAGHVGSPEDLAAIYASADIFAFPSYTDTFGQVVIEALASGLPVVGLDAPGTRDLVRNGEAGLLLSCSTGGYTTLDPAAYASLLGRLLQDETLRLSLGAIGVAQAEGCCWDAAMNAMVDCYEEAISRAVEGSTAEGSTAGTAPVWK